MYAVECLSPDITLLLQQAASGDPDIERQVFEALYAELRRLAGYQMRKERVNHTLQPTALVNEAYLRLIGSKSIAWESRAHFLNAASQIMRRILIDHARAVQSAKRPGARQRVEFDAAMPMVVTEPETVLAVDAALTKLTGLDARQARIVELRYFAGLSVEETAKVVGVSEKTVKRDWAMARAWLEGELRAL
jgi:RNA polymerase sigma-70 factor (ECF subfamily)